MTTRVWLTALLLLVTVSTYGCGGCSGGGIQAPTDTAPQRDRSEKPGSGTAQ